MKSSKRLKLSLAIIWLGITTVSVSAFFLLIEEYEALVMATYHIQPLDFNSREALVLKGNHSSYLYQLEAGSYDLRFYHFHEGELLETDYLVRNLQVEELTELFISGQVLDNRIQWRLDFHESNLEPFLWADYLEEERSYIGAGGIDEGVTLEPGQPQVLFYFAHWLGRDFTAVSLDFITENIHTSGEAFDRFEELYIVTVTRLEGSQNEENTD